MVLIHIHKSFVLQQIVATAALFLAAKVEELPKKLEFVARCSYSLLHRDAAPLEVNSEVGYAIDILNNNSIS